MENKKRLIDADALLEWFRAYTHEDILLEPVDVISEIRSFPTVDAAEVVYAEAVPVSSHINEDDTWIRMDRQCSKCEALINQSDKYCPNCGAKMDGDENG